MSKDRHARTADSKEPQGLSSLGRPSVDSELARGASPPALTVLNLSKSFGGEHALIDVSLEIRAGEIHGLLGENGSGKSTLIKVLAGYHVPERGATLAIAGEPVGTSPDQHELRRLGVRFVHQDLGLIPSLTVTDNFLLLRQDELSPVKISWQQEHRRVREALASYGVDVDPTRVVEQLSPLQQALVAVVRAVAGRKQSDPLRLLVLDEPTVFLPAKEVGMLFDLMRRVAAEGAGVLFVTHDMGEVLSITDRVTVLRDGRLQGTLETKRTGERQLVELILGHEWSPAEVAAHRTGASRREAVVEVKDLTGAGLRDISLAVHDGEVLGVTGLVGSGFEHLPYLLLGGTRAKRGSLRVGSWTATLSGLRPAAAVRAGVALVPGNRLADGVVAEFSVADNMNLPVLPSFFSALLLRNRRLVQHARQQMERVDVRPLSPEAAMSALSGGNQQKAVLAKWLQVKPRLLVLHEPTQGVDVGAREQIVKEIRAAATAGTAVIVATSDYEHLEAVADRVLVLANGLLCAELSGVSLTKQRISELCLTSTASGRPPAAGQATAAGGDRV